MMDMGNAMKTTAHTTIRAWLIAWLLLAMSAPLGAALPSQVNGQALPTLAPMLERVTPAVVNIAAIGEVKVRRSHSLIDDPFFRHFFNLPGRVETRKTRSLGSGVIVDPQKGYILTNHHVIDGASKILVKTKSGRQFEAEIIGSDESTDVAVLRIPAKGLSGIPFADSDTLRVGDFAVAIGNPFGLGQTVTSGIVSALGRSGLGLSGKKDGYIEDFIQTDASINVGNSGGALVNLRGELIGINTAILSPNQGGNVGIGFAIPINMARTVMQQLLEHGEIRRGYFGVVVQTLTPELAEALNTNLKAGAIIVSVEEDSPAEEAGIKPHDIVTHINRKQIKNAADMRNQIGLLNVGDKATIRLQRGGRELTLNTRITDAVSGKLINGEDLDYRLAGATFTNIPATSPLYGRVNGILVADVQPGSPAASAELQEGDIIRSINRQPVKDIQTATKLLSGKKSQLLLNIQRGNIAFFLLLSS